MSFTVALTGCPGLSDGSRTQAEGAFRSALLHELGGSSGVLSAFAGHADACRVHGGPPLPMDADSVSRDAVQRWDDAVGNAAEHAFMGWPVQPDGAAFTVTPDTDPAT